jgi:hypothetical protein
MKPSHNAAGAVILLSILCACNGSPTAQPATEATVPSYDGGYGMGSGNRDAPPTPTPGEDGIQADTTGRGGFTMGSGN